MKKIALILLSILILSSVLPLYVYAVPQECSAPLMEEERYNNSGPSFDFLNEYLDVAEFRSYLLGQFAKCTAEIDLSQYNLPFSDSNQKTIARYIWKEIPEAFHVGTLQFSFWKNSGVITKVTVTYTNTPAEYEAMLPACEEAADRLLDGLLDNDNLTDVEKALVLHDRLALHVTYVKDSPYCYDMYGALVNGIAVCEGYAKAYSFMLDKLGIKNFFCESRDLVHAWNILYIDGKPYHVDVTWDDPDLMNGRVNHDNFLRSTTGMRETGHTKYGTIDYNSSPVSTKYDNYFWQKSNAAFQLVQDEIYYIDNEAEKLCQMVGENGSKSLYSVEDTWRVDSQYVWTSNYSVLSSACNSLLFSKADGIYAYHLKDQTVTTVYNPSLSYGKYLSVFGFSYKNGVLVCDVRNNPDPYAYGNGAATLQTNYHPLVKDHVYTNADDVVCNICGGLKAGVEYLTGDLDGDIAVTSADAIYLLYYTLFGEDRYPINQPADFQKDGAINSADAIYLLYHTLFGEDRYPLKG